MVNLSILRARFGSRGGGSEDVSLEMSITIESLIELLESLHTTRPAGLWLSCKLFLDQKSMSRPANECL